MATVLAVQRLAAAGGAGGGAGGGVGAAGDSGGSGQLESVPVGQPEPTWSPAEVDDAALTAHLGKRAVDAARRRAKAGLRASVLVPEVGRPATGENAWAVELPTTTVRFLVPGDLGYAHTDVVATARDEQVALAVLVCRAAAAGGTAPRGATERRVEVTLGKPTALRSPGARLRPATDFLDKLILDGVRAQASRSAPRIAAALAPLREAGFNWPADCLADIAAQVSAYAGAHAGYNAGELAELVAELHARTVSAERQPHRADVVLGTEQSARTAMRRARFVGLGVRVTRSDDLGAGSHVDEVQVRTQVFLADVDAGAVVVLTGESTHAPDQVPSPGPLAKRRVGGLRLGQVATGTVVTEAATRTAGNRLTLSVGRAGKSTVTGGPGVWAALPSSQMVADVASAVAELSARPLRVVAPRFAASSVRVLRLARCLSVSYRPGEQTLVARLADAAGVEVVLHATYRASAPGALDALAQTLGGVQAAARCWSVGWCG
ncbi:MAG: hypothetical protein ACTII7_03820 [Galactobacter sp.]